MGAKSLVFSYFPGNYQELKSFDMRTIDTIPGEISGVMNMARYLEFEAILESITWPIKNGYQAS
jgi:hypothetical protein